LCSGEPNEILNFETSDHQRSTGEIIKEKSDIYRLQDEDFRERVHEIAIGKIHETKTHDDQTIVSEYDPAVRPDDKHGRLHLSIKYHNEQNVFVVKIIDAQGMIRPEQVYAPEMCLTFSLKRIDTNEQEKEIHERIFIINVPKQWQEPVTFSIDYTQIIQDNLHILARNSTDPSAPRDRQVFK